MTLNSGGGDGQAAESFAGLVTGELSFSSGTVAVVVVVVVPAIQQ